MHDFHPAISASGLYWIARVPPGALDVAGDGRSARLRLEAVDVIDQPRWPAQDAEARPARLWITVQWTATRDPVAIDDRSKHFRFRGWSCGAQAEARVEVPSIGFTWRSDPLDTSRSAFGVIGEEANGRYYDAR